MKILQASATVLALASTGLAGVVKRNSHSWAGSNLYFLQGLSDADQTAYINTLASDGAKVLRLWVNAQKSGACDKQSKIVNSVPALETTIGRYNNATLDALDKVLVKMAAKGIKALISPHDANMICGANGSDDPYCSTWGPGYFYEVQDAFNAYDNRLSFILNYQGKYSGKVWKNWKAAIMGFDLQNEPMAPKLSECTNGDVHGWVCGRAAHMRTVLGAQNPIKIGSGGIGGDYSHGCNLLPAALNCPQLDMISVHRYAGGEANNANQWANNARSWIKQTSKLLVVEEWGVNTLTYNPVTEFPANTQDMNSVGLPWLYWQILPAKECDSSINDDSSHAFGIQLGSGTDVSTPMHQASSVTGLQDWTGVIY
ncbi:hypothetical protein DL546_001301 [Coniochaeta pulveracea]|uniref:mannan endo-1,4-beta-mannosidase n=1 Tax=Coniochaeta pulveracea TaxID=177199 RepID=A0A420YN83_9PEZI|nr:hypothetical protein DL546_001301 [Coniochaeta pulveracea]